MGCGCKNKENQTQTQQVSNQTVQSSQPSQQKVVVEDIKQQIKKTVEKYYNINKSTTN
jgi:hypothetical protein